MESIYYQDTIIALKKDEYVSPQQMLAQFSELPYYDRVHAEDEIRRAVFNYYNN